MDLFIEKFRKFNQKISDWMENISLFALLFMMCTTCVDVVGTKVFRISVFGAIDMIMLGFALFVIISWRLLLYGYSLQIGGEESATARIPLYPFAYGAGIACILVCLVYLHRFIALAIKGEINES